MNFSTKSKLLKINQMNLFEFKYITDENIPPRAVIWLKAKGLDVFDIKSEGLGGTLDEDILPIAEADNRVIITQDSDLGTILFQAGLKNAGVIFLRPGHVSSEQLIKSLENLFSADIDTRIPFILVGDAKQDVFKIRLRLL
jgi:predicted nuclease of predicted toxin-antitoxin system